MRAPNSHGSERSYSWWWFKLRMLGTLLFVCVFDTGLGFVVRDFYLAPARQKGLPASGWLTVLGLVGVAASLAYATAANLINRTTLRASRTRLYIERGPLPWFGVRGLPLAEIVSVNCTEKRNSDYDGAFQTPISYSVRLLLKSGRSVKVASWLADESKALGITQFLTQLLAERHHLPTTPNW